MGTLATNVLVRRASEGPQLVLSWTNPDDVGLAAVQIRRGTLGFPETITDGVQVYLDAAPTPSDDKTFSDVNVDGQVTYYYTIFADVLGTWYGDYTTQRREFSLDGRDFPERLFNALPVIYQTRDADTLQKTLIQTLSDDGEWYNYWEDQLLKYGQLRRFLKVFGIQYGQIRELIKYMAQFYEVYQVRDDFLPYIANLIGAKMIGGISLQRQRFLIAEAVALFKIRGTIAGLVRFAEGNFGTTPMVHEFGYDMLESNRIDRTSVADDPIVLNNWNSPWNTIDYVVHGNYQEQWSYRTVGLFFDDALKTGITAEMLNIAEQFLSDYLPGTGSWFAFVHWDTLWEDEFADFANWTETDPGAYLSATGDRAVFSIGTGLSGAADITRNPGLSANTEFAADVPLDAITWPASVAGSSAYIELEVAWGANYARLLLEKDTSGDYRYTFSWNHSGGSGSQDVDLANEPDLGRLRIERGPEGLIRGLGDILGVRSVIHQVIHNDFKPAPSGVTITWSTGTTTGSFETESSWFRQWEANVGNTWEQVYP